jgi:hypothetical protein
MRRRIAAALAAASCAAAPAPRPGPSPTPAAPEPQVIGRLTAAPDRLQVAGDALYWMAGAEIWRQSLVDGTRTHALPPGGDEPVAFVAVPDGIIVATMGAGPWDIRFVPTRGPNEEGVKLAEASAFEIEDLTVYGGHVYWIEADTDPPDVIARVPLAGGPREVVVADTIDQAGSIAVDGEGLVFVVDGGGGVYRVSSPGARPAILAAGVHDEVLATPAGIVSARDGGAALLPGGVALAGGYGGIALVGATATHLYFVGDDALRRVPLAGGAVEDVFTGVGQWPVAVAIGEDSAFLAIDEGTGSWRLMKIPL